MTHPFTHTLLLSVFCSGLLLSPTHVAGQQPTEPLPINTFKNLEAGKKQTVVVYGTSLTAVCEWPKALKGYFDKQFPGLVTFVNEGKKGKSSDWGVASFKGSVLSRNPDLVFIEFSVNDAANKNHVSPDQSKANLDTMVKALRLQNPQVDIVLQTMNTAWDSPNEPEHKKDATMRPNLAQYYDIYRKYAQENGLPLVDNEPNWLKLQQTDEPTFQKWLPDGLHPTPEGSLAVTWTAIQALLEKARTQAAGH